MIITKAAFSRLGNVATSTVQSACKKHLKPAMIGKKIESTHEAAVAFLAKHKALQELEKKPEAATKPVETNSVDLSNLPDDIRDLADKMTLSELIKKFGTDTRFVDWLKAVKAIEDIHEKRLKNAATQKDLIPRKFVETHVFGYIETSNIRLLNDSPRTIAARVIEAVEAGETKEEIELMVQQIISNQIKSIKEKSKKALKNV